MEKSNRKYITPTAQITIYECADVITRSKLNETPGGNPTSGGKSYVSAGSVSWGDGLKN